MTEHVRKLEHKAKSSLALPHFSAAASKHHVSTCTGSSLGKEDIASKNDDVM